MGIRSCNKSIQGAGAAVARPSRWPRRVTICAVRRTLGRKQIVISPAVMPVTVPRRPAATQTSRSHPSQPEVQVLSTLPVHAPAPPEARIARPRSARAAAIQPPALALACSAAERRRPDRAADGRRQSDEMAPGAHDLVLRELHPQAALAGLPRVLGRLRVLLQLLLREQRRAAAARAARAADAPVSAAGARVSRLCRRGADAALHARLRR